MTAETVAADLARVKKALVAAHLDRRMPVDHDPAALVGLLAGYQRVAIAHDIVDGGYGTFAARIATGQRLSTDLPDRDLDRLPGS